MRSLPLQLLKEQKFSCSLKAAKERNFSLYVVFNVFFQIFFTLASGKSANIRKIH